MNGSIDRTAWMQGHYGLMNHWLFPGVLPEKGASAAELDEAVNRFSVDRLLEDFLATGAEWLIFTLGQNTGKYISPNSVIDAFSGKGHCSERDLALEIATRLHQSGKRFIAYLPCEVAGNPSMQPGFAWSLQVGTDQAEFQHRYLLAVKEWAERFGPLLDGWWFDGCYTWPIFHNSAMHWSAWYAASRVGNPEAVLTFNDGCFCVGKVQPVVPEHDYLSGEIEMLTDGRIRLGRDAAPFITHIPDARYVPGTQCQWHGLLPIDCFWMHGNPPPTWLPDHPYHEIDAGAVSTPMEAPLYEDDALYHFVAHCLEVGGAVTLNAGIYQEGHLGTETVRHLFSLNKRMQSHG